MLLFIEGIVRCKVLGFMSAPSYGFV